MLLNHLPPIPLEKTPQLNNKTEERRIISKLSNKIDLDESEKVSLNNILSFYKNLNAKLRTLNYSTLTEKEVLYLVKYIRDVFYYSIPNTTPIEIKKVYRIVKNESILGTNDSITKVRHLTYPPDHVVRKLKKFNRANTANASVFYGSENIETAIFELKPQVGEKVTVGEWTPIESMMFNLHIIFHEKVINHEGNISRAIKTMHDQLQTGLTELLKPFFEQYFGILGHEFSKTVTHHYEYIVSATLADIMFQNSLKSKDKMDGILYPSVNNNFHTNNLALKKSTIHRFTLSKVSEFEIKNTFYDKVWDGNLENNSSTKTLIEGVNLRETTNINKSKIFW